MLALRGILTARIPHHLGEVLVGFGHEHLVAAQERVLLLLLYLNSALLDSLLTVDAFYEFLSQLGFTGVG